MLDFSITQDSWPDSQQQFNINTKNFATYNWINKGTWNPAAADSQNCFNNSKMSLPITRYQSFTLLGSALRKATTVY